MNKRAIDSQRNEEAGGQRTETVPFMATDARNQDGVANEADINVEGQGQSDAVASPAADGGYGWVIVFASFWMQCFLALPLAYGVLYVDLLDVFEASSADTALPGSVAIGFTVLLGPLASALSLKFGHRPTGMFGGLLACAGLLSSAFVDNIYLLSLTYGVITGTGLALAFIPASVIVGFYFDKRASLANGLAVSGVGVAGMVFPICVTYLLEIYAWRGCLIIMAGITLHVCVMAALLRPVPRSKRSEQTETCSTIFDISLLKNWKLITFVLVDLFWNCGGLVWVTLIVDHGIHQGLSLSAAALLATVDGVGGVVGKLCVAVLCDHKCCNRLLVFAAAVFVCSLPQFLVSLETSYPALMCYCAVYGISFGVQLGLLPVVILELFGRSRLTSAFGYIMLGDGIGCLIGLPLGGLVFDLTKRYAISFIFSGVCCVVSAILVLIIVISRKGSRSGNSTHFPEREENETVL